MSWGAFHRHAGGPAEESTIGALDAEVSWARRKFPGNRFLLTALTEKVGELAQALLQRRNADACRRKALQIACIAIRIIEEGDASFADISAEESKP